MRAAPGAGRRPAGRALARRLGANLLAAILSDREIVAARERLAELVRGRHLAEALAPAVGSFLTASFLATALVSALALGR